MSDAANAAIEIGEEALEQKLDELTIDVTSPSSEETMRKRRLPTAERIRLWEEEQKAKNILSTGLKGKVKWYSVLRRYGFITRDDGEKDVFVHQTAISKSVTEKFYLRTLADEEEVVFDLVDGKSGPEAANVTGPDGGNVIGSRYRHKLLSRFRTNRKPSVDSEKSVEQSEDKTAEPSPKSEGSKKPKKQRKNKNRKPKARQEKGAGDAPANQSVADTSEESQSDSTSSSPDAKVSKIIDEEPGLSKINRCESDLGDAGLGADSLSIQI